MSKFIYAFSEKDRDVLLSLNLNLLSSNDEQHVYIFENRDDLQFGNSDAQFAYSDILIF